MNGLCLILNADYSPIMVSTIQRAFILIYLKKSELVESVNGHYIRSIDSQFPMPAVIKLRDYVNIPYKKVALTRQNVLKRDKFQCQYCGKKDHLTLDHIVPKSKGGKTTWENMTTACERCNALKGNNTPKEANMPLQSTPYRPSYNSFLMLNSGYIREEWLPYLG